MEIKESVGFHLSKIAQKMDKEFSSVLSEYAIDSRDYGLLVAVFNHENLTQINLGDLLLIDRTTIGQLIDQLETKRFLKRKKNPQDRRQNFIELTQKGEHLVLDMWKTMLAIESQVLHQLTPEQKKMMVTIADTIKE